MSIRRKPRWVWILLFLLIVGILGTLATGWNVVLVRDYQRFLELARDLSANQPPSSSYPKEPWINIVLGSLGFAVVVGGLFLFYLKVQKEMRLNQLQAEFLATVSHELKTPLATLELTGSLLREPGMTEDEKAKLWSSHDAELARLRSEVDALLDAAKWQSGTVKTNKTSIHLEQWLAQSVARWQKLLGPAGKLIREGDPLNFVAELDPRLLNLITDNLLDNAKKFSSNEPLVTIRSKRVSKSKWRIEIQDQGIGFSPDDSKKIFRRFFRASHEAPYAIPGTGLGLYLAASASRALDLSLIGESAGPGRGAVFSIEGKGARA